MHGRSIPPVHIAYSYELADLLRKIARGGQLIGILAAVNMWFANSPGWKTNLQSTAQRCGLAGVVCGAAYFLPDLAREVLPTLLGVG